MLLKEYNFSDTFSILNRTVDIENSSIQETLIKKSKAKSFFSIPQENRICYFRMK